MSALFLSDDKLLSACRVDVYRGSGPGGQKRNKTSNAVRLTHEATGVTVTATEARSLAENKLNAVRRLRVRIAATAREPVADVARFEPPDWLLEVRRGARLELSHRHPFYAPAGALALDLLRAAHGNPAAAALALGLSTSALVKLLEAEPEWWTAANAIRAGLGMPALTHRRA